MINRRALPRMIALLLATVLLAWANTGKVRADEQSPPHKNDRPITWVGLQIPSESLFLRPNVHRGLLARELVRQALLIAARNELGLSTRDAVLREAFPVGGTGHGRGMFVLLDIDLAAKGDWTSKKGAVPFFTGAGDAVATLKLQAAPSKAPKDAGLYAFAFKPEGYDYAQFLTETEKLSRGYFVDWLKKAGIQPRTKRPKAKDTVVPAETEERLGEMSELAQFAALRDLHSLIQAHGDGDALLGALSRAYANLGLLSEYHWNADHKVFKARALLYAQRLVARSPKSPWAYWHRAYAKALAGMHYAAMHDLDEASRQAKQTDKKPLSPPAWVGLIDAYCHFNTAKLEEEPADKSLVHLAQLLHYLTLEDLGSPASTIRAASAFLEKNPRCYRVYDASCSVGGVSHGHTATLAGLKAFTENLPQQLQEMPRLPEKVPDVNGFEDEQKAVRALGDAAKDASQAEPSWGVLALLIQEIRFTQVWRRCLFLAEQLATSVDEFRPATAPLVAGHPHEPFLHAYGLHRERDEKAYRAHIQKIIVNDIGLNELSLAYKMNQLDPARYRPVWSLAMLHGDYCLYRDSVIVLRLEKDRERVRLPEAARQLPTTSPFSPEGVESQIRYSWKTMRDKAASLEKHYHDHASVLLVLGRRHLQAKNWDAAQRCLRRSIELSPDWLGYQWLAETYKAQGQMDKWKSTLEAYLKEEDTGLGHARVRVQIADYHMSRREYEQAEPYAAAAAESWAEWAMFSAMNCYTALEEWDKAETWVQRASERYPEGACNWFLWCMMTGHGHVHDARKCMEARARELGDKASALDLLNLGACYLLDEQNEKALEALQRSFQKQDDTGQGTLLVLLADALGKTGVRDAALKRLSANGSPLNRLPQALYDSLKEGKKLDLSTIDRILNSFPASHPWNCRYFVGRFLELRGRTDEALEYYERCATEPRTLGLWRTMASHALRAHGVVPGELKNKRELAK